jgi:hypothetical protein
MEKIVLTFKFQLANGGEGTISIRDVKENATSEEIKAVSDEILARDTIINNDTPTKLLSCTKSVTVDEVLVL